MPPYHVNTTCTGINDFTYDKSNGYKDMEYLRKFPRAATKRISRTTANRYTASPRYRPDTT